MTISRSIIDAINKNFQEIIKQNTGAEFIKVDLHIHTPASGDAQAKNKYNFKFDIANIPASLEKARELAEKIVNRVVQQEIGLIAVTDHNSPSDTDPLNPTNSWYALLRDVVKDKEKDKELTVLPGVEISTDDVHILVILDPREDEPPVYMTHRINSLLQDCQFSLEEYGDYTATGMSSIFDVLEYVEDLGTNCVVIPAHIDGGNKALLDVYKKPSNVYEKLLNHPNLNVVEVVEDSTPTKRKIGKKSVKDYFESLRDKHRSPIAFIQDSDGHSIDEIGKRFTYIRMGEPDFWALRDALENPETRIRMRSEYKPDESKTRILGIAFSTGGKWSHIALNSNLNCIIGKRQTNKSTIVDLILYGLDRFEDANREDEKSLIERKYSVNVFLAKGPDVICYSRDEKGNPPTIFKKDRNDSFVPIDGEPGLELPRKYNQEAIQELFSQSTNLMDFLDRHVFMDEQIKPLLEKRNEYLDKVKNKNFTDCAADMQELVKACEQLFNEREKHIEPELEKYGKNLFKVKVTQGKWTGTKDQDFLDEATLSVLVESQYKPFNKLSTGEKNAAMMLLLMNQGAFGPLIIDEPERYLDVSSITGMLIPRMRQLKTQQQIICVTRDEHFLVSGDAEQVIATQSEQKLEVITGDLNSKDIQEQILGIFEGDRYALLEKIRRLGRILEYDPDLL
jgi:PHP family Zn ribbon phosphoesterase